MGNRSASKQDKTVPLIGTLAVKNQFISEEQLQQGLAQCSGDRNLEDQLKEFLLADNLVSSRNIHRLTTAAKAVSIHAQECRFGAMALEMGIVNKSVVELALEEQKEQIKNRKKPRRIGDVMVEAGLITTKQRDQILQRQNRPCKLSDNTAKPLSKAEHETRLEPDSHLLNQGKISSEQAILKESADPGKNLPPDRMEQVTPICGGLLLQVSCDHLSAFLSKACDMDPDIPAAVIRAAMAEKGIVHGLVPDDRIESFIKSPVADSTLFNVARGQAPSPGKETRIDFFFNTDYLKTTVMDDFGNIDFTARKTRQMVEKGTVLAEKIAGTTPLPGKDVYGKTIQAADIDEDPLRVGIGAVLSQDGQKVLASIHGVPRITLAGLIVVHDVSVINEDVDKETGVVNFEGNIRITGAVKSGAKVCGVDIEAQEVENAIIRASGDLTITRGIKDTRLYARGNIYAQSITNSQIVCMGDVIVEKLIQDSTIECSGGCAMIKGTLISSRVSAKMGVMAHSIISGKDGPSKVWAGHDAFFARELEKNSDWATRLTEATQALGEKKDGVRRQLAALKKQMNELIRVKKKIQVQYLQIESRAELPPEDRDALDKRSVKLEKTLEAAKTKVQACAAKIKALVKQAAKIDRQRAGFEASKRTLANEKKNLIRWSGHTPGNALVIVDGEIMPGSVIMGLHCKFVTDTKLCHIRIAERPVKTDNGDDQQITYQMQADDFDTFM